MTTALETLRLKMEAAAEAEDFEAAARLRDQYSLVRGQPGAKIPEEMDTSRLHRQQPGRMGLGTSEQAVVPPPGWKPPKRPDPMTSSTKPAKRRRR
jgi:hypothetical protein